MFLIVGLGNPGRKYKYTRHNLGFRLVDEFRKENNFPGLKFVKKFNAQISKGVIDNKEITLAKPQTFMNSSGCAVKKIVSGFRFHVSRTWVVHDDIDLLLGKVRISVGRGSAGHKGVESIIREIDSKDFVRFRIGIMNYELRIKNAEKFVLEKFTKEEEKIIKTTIKKTVELIGAALKQGLEKAMTEFNG